MAAPVVALRRLVRTLRTSATTVERQTGLSSAQLFLLQTLSDAPAESVNELASRTLTDQSSVSVVIARLEVKGLVTRTPSPIDARRKTVSITPAGRQLIDGAPATVQGRLVNALLHLVPPDRQQLTTLVDTLSFYLGAADDPAPFLFEDDATGSP